MLGEGHAFVHAHASLRLGGMAAIPSESIYLKNQSFRSFADLLSSHSPGSYVRKTAAAFCPVFDNGMIELLASILSNLDLSVYQESSILQ